MASAASIPDFMETWMPFNAGVLCIAAPAPIKMAPFTASSGIEKYPPVGTVLALCSITFPPLIILATKGCFLNSIKSSNGSSMGSS